MSKWLGFREIFADCKVMACSFSSILTSQMSKMNRDPAVVMHVLAKQLLSNMDAKVGNLQISFNEQLNCDTICA